jgi:hypothetical protein
LSRKPPLSACHQCLTTRGCPLCSCHIFREEECSPPRHVDVARKGEGTGCARYVLYFLFSFYLMIICSISEQ